jgi:hypothetical protein
MIRRGTVREDGKVFWAYRKTKTRTGEIWVSRDTFLKYEASRIKYSQSKMMAYKKSQESLPPDERNYLGKYNPENGLYFIRVYASGTPRYGTLEDLQNYKLKRRRQQRDCYKLNKTKIPASSVCLGDKHPNDPNLVVVEIRGHKVKYGPMQKLEKRRENIRLSGIEYRKIKGKKIVEKSREIRQKKLQFLRENPHLKYSRGDLNPLTGWKFWGYSALGNEIWLHPDDFVVRRAEFNKKRLEHYYAKRAAMGFIKKSGD